MLIERGYNSIIIVVDPTYYLQGLWAAATKGLVAVGRDGRAQLHLLADGGAPVSHRRRRRRPFNTARSAYRLPSLLVVTAPTVVVVIARRNVRRCCRGRRRRRRTLPPYRQSIARPRPRYGIFIILRILCTYNNIYVIIFHVISVGPVPRPVAVFAQFVHDLFWLRRISVLDRAANHCTTLTQQQHETYYYLSSCLVVSIDRLARRFSTLKSVPPTTRAKCLHAPLAHRRCKTV